jgi:hypothetical protein
MLIKKHERKYKFHDKEGLYFVSFATAYWIDIFIRPLYCDVLVILYTRYTCTSNADHWKDWIKLNVALVLIGEEVDIKIEIVSARTSQYHLQSALFGHHHEGIHVYIGFVDSYKEELSEAVYLGKLE